MPSRVSDTPISSLNVIYFITIFIAPNALFNLVLSLVGGRCKNNGEAAWKVATSQPRVWPLVSA